MGELVDDVEHAKLASIMGALLKEVVGPHVVRALGSGPNARSVIQPQAGALGLPRGDLQPLASPDPLDPLVVDQPADGRRTLAASGSKSPRSPRSSGSLPLRPDLARSKHQPAAAWRRSLPACSSSLAFWSSL